MQQTLLTCLLMTALLSHAEEGQEMNRLNSLQDVAWMAGHWVNQDHTSEEYWSRPAGGMMLGWHRDLRPEGKAFFEYLRMEQTEQNIEYHAGPMGRAATVFRLVQSSDRKAVFENPDHDFPRRISYRLDDQGSLDVRVEGTIKGKPHAEQWIWTRSAASGSGVQ